MVSTFFAGRFRCRKRNGPRLSTLCIREVDSSFIRRFNNRLPKKTFVFCRFKAKWCKTFTSTSRARKPAIRCLFSVHSPVWPVGGMIATLISFLIYSTSCCPPIKLLCCDQRNDGSGSSEKGYCNAHAERENRDDLSHYIACQAAPGGCSAVSVLVGLFLNFFSRNNLHIGTCKGPR